MAVKNSQKGKCLPVLISKTNLKKKVIERTQALKALSKRQEALLSAIPDIVMEVNKKKVYTWANKAGKKFFGRDVIGKEASFYFAGKQKTYEIVKPLFAGKENVYYLESWQRRKDGEKRLLAWWCRVLKNEKGKVVGAISSARDITEQKEAKEALEESEHRLNDIIEFLPDATMVINKDREVVIWNKAIAKMTGIKPEKILGKKNYEYTLPFYGERRPSLMDFILGKEKQVIKKYANVIRAKDSISAETFCNALYGGKGAQVFAKVSLLRNKKGKVVGAIESIRDITKEKEIDRQKSEFVSLTSHQLRTPTAAIGWYAEALLGSNMGPLNQKQRDYIKTIYESNRRMIELVNTLLTVTRIELGRFVIKSQKFDPVELVNEILKEFGSEVEQKKLEIQKDFGKDIIFKNDPALLHIIFQNFISNAIGYTPENGLIKISIKKIENNLLFKIKDTGCGIPIGEQKNIFNKFFRAENARVVKPDGTGLGLYITNYLTKTLRGKIKMNSQEGAGTTFSVKIPDRNT